MTRITIALALLSGLAVQDEPVEKLAETLRAAIAQNRVGESLRILETIERRGRRWDRRDLVLEAVDLLRRLQADFPSTVLGDERIRSAVENLTGHGFLSFPCLSRPGPLRPSDAPAGRSSSRCGRARAYERGMCCA